MKAPREKTDRRHWHWPLLLALFGALASTHARAACEQPGVQRAPSAIDNERVTSASTGSPPPGSARRIRPVHVDVPPLIDGCLSDIAWIDASISGGFWVTSQERWPAEPTEVMVAVDDENIYVAIHAFDSRPDQIVALETVRDRGLGVDDHVTVEIDAFGDHAGVSQFSVNVAGTQDDEIAGGRAAKMSWKGLWTAAAERTDDGWVAEMAIPFEILNYRPGTHEFAVNFTRYHNRTREWSQWADVTPQNKKEEMGRLVDLVLPTRDGTQTWTLMPYVLSGSNVPDRDGEVQSSLIAGGIDIRYTPTSNLTNVISLNPDFSQLEKQFANANFSYNERRIDDPRVFFIEGADYLGADERIFYSRRVPDFDAGSKAFGQTGAIRYSGFVTSSPDSRTDALGRVSFAPDATHNGFLSLVQTNRAEGNGSTIALGVKGREDVGAVWDATYIKSNDSFDDSPLGSGAMLDMSAAWQGDYIRAGVGFDNYDKGFDPANGLIKKDRLGTNNRTIFTNYFRDYGRERISQGSLYFETNKRKTDDGRTQRDEWIVGGSVELQQFVLTSLSYSDGDYRPLSGDGPGEFGDTVNNDRFWTAALDFNTRSSRIGAGTSYSSGKLGGGDYNYLINYVWSRPTPTTSLNVTTERLTSFGTFTQFVVDGSWDLNPTNGLIFRHVHFDGDDYWRMGYSRVVAQGLDIFFLYDRSPERGTQLSVKFLWAMSPAEIRRTPSRVRSIFATSGDSLKERLQTGQHATEGVPSS